MTEASARITTASALIDWLQEHMGVGQYDELVAPNPPWWKYRQAEAAKLNKLMKQRRVTLDQLILAAEYCKRNAVHLKAPAGLFFHVDQAKREARELAIERRAEERRTTKDGVISAALEAGELDFADQLMRATGTAVEELMGKWVSTHG